MCRILRRQGFLKVYAKSLSEKGAITGVGIMAGSYVALFYKERHTLHGAGCILACHFLLIRRHQPPQFTGLGIVVVILLTLVVVVHGARGFQRRLLHGGRILPFAKAVRLIRHSGSIIVVGAHLAVAVV